jgi:hypothetical protein
MLLFILIYLFFEIIVLTGFNYFFNIDFLNSFKIFFIKLTEKLKVS